MTTQPDAPGPARWALTDPRDAARLADDLGGLDVLVNAINSGNDVPGTIANAATFPKVARALLTAMESLPRLRLIVIGGAGSLEVAPGTQVADVEGFAEQLPAALGSHRSTSGPWRHIGKHSRSIACRTGTGPTSAPRLAS